MIEKYGFEGFIDFAEDDMKRNIVFRQQNPEDSIVSFYYKGELLSIFDKFIVKIKVTLIQYRKKIDLTIVKKVD